MDDQLHYHLAWVVDLDRRVLGVVSVDVVDVGRGEDHELGQDGLSAGEDGPFRRGDPEPPVGEHGRLVVLGHGDTSFC